MIQPDRLLGSTAANPTIRRGGQVASFSLFARFLLTEKAVVILIIFPEIQEFEVTIMRLKDFGVVNKMG